ncbi:glycosyltransferase family 2 protein [Arcanobacterium ihumii]|uniref:glycosyltransferase family 2 protein n=1 Tax=Arcanobacterium ihumii TaxID=2138162 RepID=UPI000F529EA6|nr:glycosyltransferase family 2 protein [Arcanobacterium ihumii]
MVNTNVVRDASIWAVIVTFHPDERTHRLIEVLTRQVQKCIVVDNGSTERELAALVKATDSCEAKLCALGSNMGIAYAQNVGIEIALEANATHVLLSDQDSLPPQDMVSALLEAMEETGAEAVGPFIRDNNGGDDELVYISRTWGPRRASTNELRQHYVNPAFLLASGCLISSDCLREVGLMNDDYFIDHVDLEWCLRVRAHGKKIVVTTDTVLDHSLGDQTERIPFRAQPVHVHAPIRNYYLTRNTILLCKSGLLTRRWIVGYLVWLAKYVGFNILLAPQRFQRASYIGRAIIDGITGKTGKYSIRR